MPDTETQRLTLGTHMHSVWNDPNIPDAYLGLGNLVPACEGLTVYSSEGWITHSHPQSSSIHKNPHTESSTPIKLPCA